MKLNTQNLRRAMLLAATLTFIFSPSARAQNNACRMNDGYARYYGWAGDLELEHDHRVWRAVAAAGTIDPNDLNDVMFGGDAGTAFLRPGASAAVLRYNIGKEFSFGAGPNTSVYGLRVRYSKPNAGSRVIVRLKAYNLKTGLITTLGTFDSDECDTPVAAGFQWRTRSFVRNDDPTERGSLAYYLEAQLIRTAPNGNPGLGVVMVGAMGG
jgi:hypothetical protein